LWLIDHLTNRESKLRQRIPPGSRIRVAGLTQTFLAEAGVLLLVFPVLERFVKDGIEHVTWQLVAGSLSLSGGLFVGAATIAVFAAGGEK